MNEAPEFRVFLSHRGGDETNKEVMKNIKTKLENVGITAFVDAYDLHSAKGPPPENIIRALKNAEVVVFLMSPQFWTSQYCIKELEIAQESEKKMLFIMPGSISNMDEKALEAGQESKWKAVKKNHTLMESLNSNVEFNTAFSLMNFFFSKSRTILNQNNVFVCLTQENQNAIELRSMMNCSSYSENRWADTRLRAAIEVPQLDPKFGDMFFDSTNLVFFTFRTGDNSLPVYDSNSEGIRWWNVELTRILEENKYEIKKLDYWLTCLDVTKERLGNFLSCEKCEKELCRRCLTGVFELSDGPSRDLLSKLERLQTESSPGRKGITVYQLEKVETYKEFSSRFAHQYAPRGDGEAADSDGVKVRLYCTQGLVHRAKDILTVTDKTDLQQKARDFAGINEGNIELHTHSGVGSSSIDELFDFSKREKGVNPVFVTLKNVPRPDKLMSAFLKCASIPLHVITGLRAYGAAITKIASGSIIIHLEGSEVALKSVEDEVVPMLGKSATFTYIEGNKEMPGPEPALGHVETPELGESATFTGNREGSKEMPSDLGQCDGSQESMQVDNQGHFFLSASQDLDQDIYSDVDVTGERVKNLLKGTRFEKCEWEKDMAVAFLLGDTSQPETEEARQSLQDDIQKVNEIGELSESPKTCRAAILIRICWRMICRESQFIELKEHFDEENIKKFFRPGPKTIKIIMQGGKTLRGMLLHPLFFAGVRGQPIALFGHTVVSQVRRDLSDQVLWLQKIYHRTVYQHAKKHIGGESNEWLPEVLFFSIYGKGRQDGTLFAKKINTKDPIDPRVYSMQVWYNIWGGSGETVSKMVGLMDAVKSNSTQWNHITDEDEDRKLSLDNIYAVVDEAHLVFGANKFHMDLEMHRDRIQANLVRITATDLSIQIHNFLKMDESPVVELMPAAPSFHCLRTNYDDQSIVKYEERDILDMDYDEGSTRVFEKSREYKFSFEYFLPERKRELVSLEPSEWCQDDSGLSETDKKTLESLLWTTNTLVELTNPTKHKQRTGDFFSITPKSILLHNGFVSGFGTSRSCNHAHVMFAKFFVAQCVKHIAEFAEPKSNDSDLQKRFRNGSKMAWVLAFPEYMTSKLLEDDRYPPVFCNKIAHEYLKKNNGKLLKKFEQVCTHS